MMVRWPGGVSELLACSHCEEERAGLYHALDGDSAEIEVLELLEALVRLFKPAAVLETRADKGCGALALASGLRSNGYGLLHTVAADQGQADLTVKKLVECGEFSQAHCDDPLHFLATYQGRPFELCVFDGHLDLRVKEYRLCEERGLLAAAAVCVFHDTSPLRSSDPCPSYLEFLGHLRDLYGSLTCNYSRGLTIIQRREKG
jgi:hypothetical protein